MRGIHAMSEAESLFMLAALRVLLPLHDAIGFCLVYRIIRSVYLMLLLPYNISVEVQKYR